MGICVATDQTAYCFGAPPTSLCSPSRCCRGLLLLRLISTPPLHSTAAAAAAAAETAAAAGAACAAGPEASPQQQHTASPVINLSHVGKVKSDGQEGSQDTAVCHYYFFCFDCLFGDLLCCQGKSEQVSSRITLATLAWLHGCSRL